LLIHQIRFGTYIPSDGPVQLSRGDQFIRFNRQIYTLRTVPIRAHKPNILVMSTMNDYPDAKLVP